MTRLSPRFTRFASASRLMAAAGLLAALGVAAPADAGYRQLAGFDAIDQGGSSFILSGSVLDGATSYHTVSGNNRITKLEQVGGTPVFSELVDNATWQAAAGSPTSFMTIYGLGLSGQYLQFADSTSDQVYRVDTTTTNSVSVYASKATIESYLVNSLGLAAGTEAQLLSPHTVHTASGEHYFYEGSSDTILRTNGANTVETFLSAATLTSVAGNAAVDGGITFDASGNLYWGNNDNDALYVWNTSGSTGNQVLSAAQIQAVTGATSTGFADIYFAPDGNIYFYDSRADSILAFDPTDAVNTLSVVLSDTQLSAGPAGTDAVSNLTWWSGNGGVIGWDVLAGGGKGLYAIPEPASLMALGVGALAMARRRRRDTRR